MIIIKEIIEVPPVCTWCENFKYEKDADEKYICKSVCMRTNDIFEMWEECPFLDKKYLVRETGDDDDAE